MNALIKPEHIGSALNIISRNITTYLMRGRYFKNEGIRIYDELQYGYQRLKIECPLCESMMCRSKLCSIRRLGSVSQFLV